MTWKPKWMRKREKASVWLKSNQEKVDKQWNRWFAWHPVTANYNKKLPFYYDDERKAWLRFVDRAWYRAHEYDDFHWIYYIAPKEQHITEDGDE